MLRTVTNVFRYYEDDYIELDAYMIWYLMFIDMVQNSKWSSKSDQV